ncbi:hypothetical protein DFH29DRAFT_1066868 [Suillus ampliporus]|nr:hypothetical protein DFH29DRAFT_1066868 [Suillus ampliporus]
MSSHFYNYSSNGLFESSVALVPRAHSLAETFQCMWGYPYGLHCNYLIRGHDMSAHMHDIHGIDGPDQSRIECKWNHCGQELILENLSKHVEQIHLGIVYSCDCGKTFSCRDILDTHKKHCSSQE